jgi:hypothetical protein
MISPSAAGAAFCGAEIRFLHEAARFKMINNLLHCHILRTLVFLAQDHINGADYSSRGVIARRVRVSELMLKPKGFSQHLQPNLGCWLVCWRSIHTSFSG